MVVEHERIIVSAGRRSLLKVSEHHSRAKNHSGWVGTVSAHDITMTSWFELRKAHIPADSINNKRNKFGNSNVMR